MIGIRNYAIVTAASWAFTTTDGALRLLVLLHFNQLGSTPVGDRQGPDQGVLSNSSGITDGDAALQSSVPVGRSSPAAAPVACPYVIAAH
ncbi:MAG: hypothetical protein WD227_10530 [Vicinamibacterales bacterium]